MDAITLAKIKKWIYENHEHHTADYESGEVQCSGGDNPYVGSLELEKFLDGLGEDEAQNSKESILMITDDYRKVDSWFDEHPQFNSYTSKVLTTPESLRGYKGQKYVVIDVPKGMKFRDLEEFMHDNIGYKENRS